MLLQAKKMKTLLSLAVVAVLPLAGCASLPSSSSDLGNSGTTDLGNPSAGLQTQSSGSDPSQSSDSSGSSNSQSSGSDSSGSSASGSSGESTQSTNQASGNSQSVLTAASASLALSGVGLLMWYLMPSSQATQSSQSSGKLSDSSESGKRKRRRHRLQVAAMTYLRAQSDQLLEDLALGAGPTIDDLAGMARLRPENVARFGRLLRLHRAELVPLLAPDGLTPEGAERAFQRIGEISWADPALREDGERYLASVWE